MITFSRWTQFNQ